MVAKEQAKFGITPIHGSVRALLGGKISAERMDLGYAAGLFDNLANTVARRLCSVLFDSIAPGGRPLIGNFIPENHGRAYMEAFMDWHLIYRDEY